MSIQWMSSTMHFLDRLLCLRDSHPACQRRDTVFRIKEIQITEYVQACNAMSNTYQYVQEKPTESLPF